MTTAASEVDVVKRGYLRYKTANTGGTIVALQSKGFKEYWFLFRAQKKAKLLEYYGSEREANKKNASPRGVVQLQQIRAVGWGDSDRQKQFILYSSDGSHHYMDAPSVYEATEWITALNSVLFAKGPDGGQIINFNVEVWDSALLHYSGGGILEVRDDELIVWSVGNHREVVRWKLGHIRSFKAKHNQLHILAGSRSSTGEGIFVFGTQQSVLITHTLETVIEILAKQKKERQSPAQQLPVGGGFMPRNQSPGIPEFLAQRRFPPTLPQPYRETHSNSVVPGFSDVPLGHHVPESPDGSYNKLSYGGDLGDDGSPYSRLGEVSQQPRLHPPQRARSAKVQSIPSQAEYSSLHLSGVNRSSSHEALDTLGGIYSDVSDNEPYNHIGVNSTATNESNYAEVKNTSPNLQARGARPGSYNALWGVEVGVVDHTQNPPPYSLFASGDSDRGQYSQLHTCTTPPQSFPVTSEKYSPSDEVGDLALFDPHGSVVLDPTTGSPIPQTKFKQVRRESSYEPEESADDFYYKLTHAQDEDSTAPSASNTTSYEGLYSSLNTVTITGPPSSSGREEEQDTLLNSNPDLRQPTKVPRNPVACPPIPPRRSINSKQIPTQPSQPHLQRSKESSSRLTSTHSSSEGASHKSDRPQPPVAPKPKPRK